MLAALATIVVAAAALRAGYVMGWKKGQRYEAGRRTWLVRPHTAETLEQHPTPELDGDPSTIVEPLWGRHELPNSGVRWS